jgi:hypothetical protein
MELDAGIAIQIGSIVDDKLAPMHKRMDKMNAPKPIRRRFGGSGVGAAGQVINIPSYPICPEGRMWVIRKVGLFGSDTHTTVTGATADIFAGSMQDLNTSDFEGVFESAVTIPFNANFGNRHITLYAMDQVYALVSGAAAGQVLVLTGEADEFVLDEVEACHA